MSQFTLKERINNAVRIAHDFPKPGISFKDITPIFYDPILVKDCVQALCAPYKHLQVSKILGVESRGFILGPMMAQELQCAFVMVRKKGKLPHETLAVSYELEYGSATIEVQRDAITKNDIVVIHDDLIATGGTAAAAAQLCIESGAQIAGFSFVIALDFLPGIDKLKPFSQQVNSLISYSN